MQLMVTASQSRGGSVHRQSRTNPQWVHKAVQMDTDADLRSFSCRKIFMYLFMFLPFESTETLLGPWAVGTEASRGTTVGLCVTIC